MLKTTQKSYSVDELNLSAASSQHDHRPMSAESQLKRQLSQDLANDPTLATVFNPPQIFSDDVHTPASGVVVWTNNDNMIVSCFFKLQPNLKCL